MPRVSVVIPAYNAEQHLRETLASAEVQTFDDWEVIVADDGSTDRTVEIAASFGRRFRVLTHQSNDGPAAARNRALAVASGELIAFLDADDLWLPTFLQRMVALYEESSRDGRRGGIFTADARLLTPDGFLSQTYLEMMRSPREVTLARMLRGNAIYGSLVVPRAVIAETGDFCTLLFGTEDYDLWLRILELGYTIVGTREVLCTYRMLPGSVSAHTVRMARSLQLTYERALQRGRLTAREKRIARRQLRLQRALEQTVVLVTDGSWARLVLSFPRMLRVAAENPDRWPAALRLVTGRASPLSQIAKS